MVSMIFSPDDDRLSYTFKISQNDCSSIAFSDWDIKFKDGHEDKVTSIQNRVDLIDGQFHGTMKESWLPDGIESFQTDINTEHCNEHGMWKINQEKKSLDYIWRFECPNGNSPWFTPDTKEGWPGQRYYKI
jgi:hypothetical protein